MVNRHLACWARKLGLRAWGWSPTCKVGVTYSDIIHMCLCIPCEAFIYGNLSNISNNHPESGGLSMCVQDFGMFTLKIWACLYVYGV